MKITKTDINLAIRNTPSILDHSEIRSHKSILLGFYTPRDSNWTWELHVISYQNEPLLVAARFGFIVGEGE